MTEKLKDFSNCRAMFALRNLAFPGCCAVWLRNFFPTLQGNVPPSFFTVMSIPSSTAFIISIMSHSQAWRWRRYVLRNVRKKLHSQTAQQPRRSGSKPTCLKSKFLLLLRKDSFAIILSSSFAVFCLCMIHFLWKNKPRKVLIKFEGHSPRIRNNIT